MVDHSPKKILVVDDEQETLTHISNILKRANYQVVPTSKGREALELASSLKPDLIILDVMLPDMDGSEIAAVLSSDPSTDCIPIIFLTGIITKQEESWVKRTGRHYLMAKPTTGRELLEMVKRVLSN
jgi:CheY-like chemotaxis protein